MLSCLLQLDDLREADAVQPPRTTGESVAVAEHSGSHPSDGPAAGELDSSAAAFMRSQQDAAERRDSLPDALQSRVSSSTAAAVPGRDQRDQAGRWGRSPPVKELEREMRRLLDGGRAGAAPLASAVLPPARWCQRSHQQPPSLALLDGAELLFLRSLLSSSEACFGDVLHGCGAVDWCTRPCRCSGGGPVVRALPEGQRAAAQRGRLLANRAGAVV